MIFRSKARVPVSLEFIAFADIVMNLFIFFLMSFGLFASFDARQSGLLPVHLPRAKQIEAATESAPLVVTINRRGNIFVGAKPIPFSQLEKLVNLELANKREKNVVIRPDRAVTLEQFVPLLETLRRSDAASVSIETELAQ